MDQPTSPFAGKPIGSTKRPLPPFITVNDQTVPTELQAYCDYLNDGKFWGRWHFVIDADEENDLPRRVGSMLVDEDTWKANKARQYRGALLDRRSPA